MGEVEMLLDDPELSRRGPGEEFALAYARADDKEKAAVELRAAISELFPPARRRPRLTVRHLLRKAVVDREEVGVFTERAAGGALLDRLATAGVRISRTRMIPAGSALVGDFTAAATLLDQRRSTIRMDGPALVAEIREALAVHLPGHFVLAGLREE